MHMAVRVHNLKGTAERPAPSGYSSWREWWEARKKRKFDNCANLNCKNPAEVGGHVQKDDLSDRKWSIVPLCKECNKKTDSFYVREDDLEPVNQ